MLSQSSNPLFGESVETTDVSKITSATQFTRKKAHARRELRDLRRAESAAAAIADLTRDIEIYGFTKGQFSLLDLITACVSHTGTAEFVVSTWTAARHEILKLQDLRDAGAFRSVKWIVDFTFARRDPEAAHQIRQTFGLDSMRVVQNHSKFCLFTNRTWKLVLRSSMNLNMNPRFEDFTIAHDPQLAKFISTIVAEIWAKQKRSLANESPAVQREFFKREL